MRGRTRGKTVSRKDLRRVVRWAFEALDQEEHVELARIRAGERPRCRADCARGPRPCPYLGCRYHLALDAKRTGALFFPFGEDLELEQLAETCVLDVAERGGVTLEAVGALLNLTRERVRQIETAGLLRLKAIVGDVDDLARGVRGGRERGVRCLKCRRRYEFDGNRRCPECSPR